MRQKVFLVAANATESDCIYNVSIRALNRHCKVSRQYLCGEDLINAFRVFIH